jgi:hypothetical protein
LNYEDEPYVRLYTRRTATNRRLGWEGRAIMHEMLYEFDRAGVFEVGGDAVEAIALVTMLPVKVIKVGLERLIKTGTWELRGTAVVWPRYLEAQTAKRSDAVRAAEYRARRRDGVTERDETVTPRDESSRPVTDRHEESLASQNVTLCSALLSSAEENKIPTPPSESEQPKPPPKDPMLATFGKNPPGKRPDVARVWEAFKRALKLPPKSKLGLGRPWDPEAQLVADAIDAYDEATCLMVVAEAPNDGMVNGTQDERGVKHTGVAYIFENQNTFKRLLAAAETKKRRNSGIDALTRAATAEPDLTNYRDPEVA